MTGKAWIDMKIAVTYENGQVFQHFGHSGQFKVYEVEDGKVIKSEVVGTNGQGHGALAGFLLQGNVDVLICGGIGGATGMRMRRWRLIWRESLIMTRIRCAAIMGISTEKADAGITADRLRFV